MDIGKRAIGAGTFAAFALSGCYVVPIAPDGTPVYPYPTYPINVPAPLAVPDPVGSGPHPQSAMAMPPVPSVLQARLYPSNDVATRVGMLSGSVTNLMTGKGRFQLDYRGEILVGEATRTPGEERAGVANAYGDRGTYMNCTYRMTTPFQGTGTCNLSTGAQYQVHLGG